jgi:hypothetical protein
MVIALTACRGLRQETFPRRSLCPGVGPDISSCPSMRRRAANCARNSEKNGRGRGRCASSSPSASRSQARAWAQTWLALRGDTPRQRRGLGVAEAREGAELHQPGRRGGGSSSAWRADRAPGRVRAGPRKFGRHRRSGEEGARSPGAVADGAGNPIAQGVATDVRPLDLNAAGESPEGEETPPRRPGHPDPAPPRPPLRFCVRNQGLEDWRVKGSVGSCWRPRPLPLYLHQNC